MHFIYYPMKSFFVTLTNYLSNAGVVVTFYWSLNAIYPSLVFTSCTVLFYDYPKNKSIVGNGFPFGGLADFIILNITDVSVSRGLRNSLPYVVPEVNFNSGITVL